MRIDEIARRKGMTPAELGRIAGKTEKKAKNFKIYKRRKCNSKCPLFGRCIFQPLSKEKFNGRCALANSSTYERTKINYVKILTGDEDDFTEVVKNILSDIYLDTKKEASLTAKRNLLQDLIKVNETIYGRKLRQKINAEIRTVTIEDQIKIIKGLMEDEHNKNENKRN